MITKEEKEIILDDIEFATTVLNETSIVLARNGITKKVLDKFFIELNYIQELLESVLFTNKSFKFFDDWLSDISAEFDKINSVLEKKGVTLNYTVKNLKPSNGISEYKVCYTVEELRYCN